jgi:chromosome segregation protein
MPSAAAALTLRRERLRDEGQDEAPDELELAGREEELELLREELAGDQAHLQQLQQELPALEARRREMQAEVQRLERELAPAGPVRRRWSSCRRASRETGKLSDWLRPARPSNRRRRCGGRSMLTPAGRRPSRRYFTTRG